MHDFLQYFVIDDINILNRIVCSVILGFSIGLERELTNKSAGLRTQIMVCMGSCIYTILSIYGFSTAVTLYPLGDPARVSAQIITGIGFIGAGTILRQGFTVTGLTTASTLWIVAAIGMACGCGYLNVAIVSTVFALALLIIIRIFEFKLLPGNLKHMRKVKMTFMCRYENYHEIHSRISEIFPDIAEYGQKTVDEDGNMIKVSAKLLTREKNPVNFICEKIENVQNIQSLSIKEIFD